MKSLVFLMIVLILSSCNNKNKISDATGTFEAEEVIVSSEIAGKLLSFNVEEGDRLTPNAVVGTIDAESLELQKDQVEASIVALQEKTMDVRPQVAVLQGQLSVQETQLNTLMTEKRRTENLVRADAAPGKQLDDINNAIAALQRQMDVTIKEITAQRSNIGTHNSSVLSEKQPLLKTVAQLNERISKASIVNPVAGTVLTKYAEAGEMTAAGKALYKIADLSYLDLRAYITGGQFSKVKLGQPVKVLIDKGDKDYKEYTGTITWISGKAEFTPKTIQTKEERANLVYAMKVRVKNDGYLKIGMYGEAKFLCELSYQIN
jgi:HlyD family secretion protein